MGTSANTSSITVVNTSDKLVAWGGESLHLALGGLQPANGRNMTITLDEANITVPQREAGGVVTIDVPITNVTEAMIQTLKIEDATFNITVLPQPTSNLTFAEDSTWLEMFDAASNTTLDGWNLTGWSFDTVANLSTVHASSGRDLFSRGSGLVAHTFGGGAGATLESPEIKLDNKGSYELRFASQYNSTGAADQVGRVSASYDDGAAIDILTYNGTVWSNQERVRLSPPSNTSSVRFTWSLEKGRNASFWMIDEVEVVHPLRPIGADERPLETIDIISDIQGFKPNGWMANTVLPGLRKLGHASTLVINGDLVYLSIDENYTNYTTALNSTGAWDYYQNNIISVAGNHELMSLDSDEVNINRFLSQTGMDPVGGQGGLWGEVVTASGTPIIWFASEHYNVTASAGLPPSATISDRQFLYVADRLAHWRNEHKQVLLFTHHPLPHSVSQPPGEKFYVDDTTRLQYLLAANPHAVFITSHTHFDIGYNDQNVHYRPVPGHPGRVWTFNTGSIMSVNNPLHPEPHGQTVTGMQAHVYADRIQIRAFKFLNQSTDGVLAHSRDVGAPVNSTNGENGSHGNDGDGKNGAIGLSWSWNILAVSLALVCVL